MPKFRKHDKVLKIDVENYFRLKSLDYNIAGFTGWLDNSTNRNLASRLVVLQTEMTRPAFGEEPSQLIDFIDLQRIAWIFSGHTRR